MRLELTAGLYRRGRCPMLRSFKAQTRADLDGNMTSAAQLLSEKDIEVLADYLAGRGAP